MSLEIVSPMNDFTTVLLSSLNQKVVHTDSEPQRRELVLDD